MLEDANLVYNLFFRHTSLAVLGYVLCMNSALIK